MSTYSLGKHQNWSSPVSRRNVWYKELYSLNTSILRQTAMASDQHCLFLYPPRCLVTHAHSEQTPMPEQMWQAFIKGTALSLSVHTESEWLALVRLHSHRAMLSAGPKLWTTCLKCSLCGANCSTQAFWVQLLGMWFPTKLSGEYSLS